MLGISQAKVENLRILVWIGHDRKTGSSIVCMCVSILIIYSHYQIIEPGQPKYVYVYPTNQKPPKIPGNQPRGRGENPTSKMLPQKTDQR